MIVVSLTKSEWSALRACISGELDNDDGRPSEYMAALRRVIKKLRP